MPDDTGRSVATGATGMSGKTVVITGGSSGIGRAAARALAADGARVAVVGRNPERTHQVADEIGGEAFLADFDRLDDVRRLADALLTRFARIDVLANNAGGLISKRADTVDGHERTIQSNHFAPFLLTNLLLPRLRQNAAEAPVRIIATASSANSFGRLRLDDLDLRHRRWLAGWSAYGQAKLANIVFTDELARRTAGSGIEAYSFHPGFVATSFGADTALLKFANTVGGGRLGLSPEAGAVPLVQLASVPNVGSPSGTYFSQLKPNGHTARQAGDAALASAFWAASERAVGWSAPPTA
ncbi:SDR family NAD(P)-dependent oxidoreductase [Subtercola sp. RTI3]|uniref:SDR family NAD(P)-dependent oxidoreductase n=1 Tax=Subtercola sp. RTI3 TaxID=3048639 RepID=UPI002B238421|nr:SDR family NAD(P)-dependent oxidoreductase [Subtercola sp. RTI3]MEA9985213.1 SDR family NAD(P)-dependent oxidoreductase [Subtercola sp. RTI3]